MDVNEYIASGILEAVVFGSASDQEVREVQCMTKIYPEIDQEFRAVSAAFENIALQTAIELPDSFKDRVMNAIQDEAQLSPEMPAQASEPRIVQMPVKEESTAIQRERSNPWKWMAAACIVMVVGIGVMWLGSSRMNKELTNEIASLQKDNRKTENVLTAMKVQQERTEAIQKVLADESMLKITMKGLDRDPAAKVKVMWSDASEKAVMQAVNITPPPTDMQYQLWAIADGKPVSLGLFDYEEVMGTTEPFEVNADNVSAFAITLEKRGGSPVPTMENMVVMGTVNS